MKIKTIRFLQMFAFFLVFVLLTYAVASIFAVKNSFVPYEKESLAFSQPVFILDAGHGGMDGGAVSPDGILEKDLNLAIVNFLNDFLKSAGVTTILTRDTDEMLTLENGGKRKMQDLKARLNFAKSNPNAVFVSVHMNNFTQSKYSGLQVYYSKNNPNSHELANTIQENIKRYIQPQNTRVTKEATSSIFLLDRMDNTSVLVECGFLSNQNEAALLNSTAYQKQLAFMLACSLIEHANFKMIS